LVDSFFRILEERNLALNAPLTQRRFLREPSPLKAVVASLDLSPDLRIQIVTILAVFALEVT